MIKKILAVTLLLSIAGCSWWKGEPSKVCPRALIQRKDAYMIQKSMHYEEFMIELVGQEGFCYFDNRVNHDKAVVSPIFKIKRLRPNDETDVMFSYYTETVKGPPAFLGKKTYFAKVYMPADETEIEYRAKETEVRIPPGMKYDFDINLGLNIRPRDRSYNQRTFDVPLEYEEK